MNHKELQHEVLSCIWSRDLRNYLLETNYTFTEEELLGIAYHFSPDCARRLQLLELLAEHAQYVSDHARRCILFQQKTLKLFRQAGANEVYELCIKDTPDAYEERYLCASYEAAIEMIDGYYGEYGHLNDCEETELSRYTITKRKILQSGETFREDAMGECVLGPGKTVLSVDMYTNETENGTCCGSCNDCENNCVKNIDVCFPACLPDRSAVRYLLGDGSLHYGVLFEDGRPGDVTYIIPLDGDMLRNREYDSHWGYHWHEHIRHPLVEAVDPDLLPVTLKENYYAFLQYLKTRNDL